MGLVVAAVVGELLVEIILTLLAELILVVQAAKPLT
jgi:hypothetical protein